MKCRQGIKLSNKRHALAETNLCSRSVLLWVSISGLGEFWNAVVCLPEFFDSLVSWLKRANHSADQHWDKAVNATLCVLQRADNFEEIETYQAETTLMTLCEKPSEPHSWQIRPVTREHVQILLLIVMYFKRRWQSKSRKSTFVSRCSETLIATCLRSIWSRLGQKQPKLHILPLCSITDLWLVLDLRTLQHGLDQWTRTILTLICPRLTRNSHASLSVYLSWRKSEAGFHHYSLPASALSPRVKKKVLEVLC